MLFNKEFFQITIEARCEKILSGIKCTIWYKVNLVSFNQGHKYLINRLHNENNDFKSIEVFLKKSSHGP